LQFRSYPALALLVLAVVVPVGCGKDNDGGDATTAGNAGVMNGGAGGNRGGSGGSNPGTSGSAPTGCEGLMPMTGEECDDTGLVCPNTLGSCVCQRSGGQRSWECFEVGGGEGEAGSSNAGGAGGAGDASEGGGGQGVGGAAGGEGGAIQGGDANGGALSGGAGGAD
jgi:hypothetical protein